jgi:CHAT domain
MFLIYEDFHLLLVPDGHDGFQVHASFREQRASGPLVLPSEFWDPSVVEKTSPEKVGTRLFQALLGGEVGRLFDKIHGACETDPKCALRLRLHFPPREKRAWRLQNLPWELLHHPGDHRFLVLGRRLTVVRSLDTSRPLSVVPGAPALRVLIAMANPRNTPPLALSSERIKIEHAFSRIKRTRIEVLKQATLQEMRLRLRDGRFHIVHFMGHGIQFDEATGEGALLFESPRGEVDRLSATKLAELFEDLEAPLLVVLNACHTAVTPEGVDPLRSVAASLVVAGLPAVLAHRAPIWDDSALILAEELYLRLAQGDPIEAAVAEARRALRLEERGTTDWTVPSLFVRPVPAEEIQDDEDSNPTNLKTLFLLTGSIGSLLPGFVFFLDLAPPLLPEVKLLPALAAAAVAIAFAWPRKRLEDGKRYKRELSRAALTILASLLLVLLYIASYRFTTVSPPLPPPTITCQTGLDLAYLTQGAQQFIQTHPASANAQDLMLAYAAFAGCRTDLIWERWSIITSGVILIMLFLTASILWAFGFAWLARLLPRPSNRTTQKSMLATVFLLALSLCSCMSERLLSSHATAEERIKRLEDKARELDERSAPPKMLPQSSLEKRESSCQ